MAGKQLHKSITTGRCVSDSVPDSFEERFLPQFLPLWGFACFYLFFFFYFLGIMVLSNTVRNLIRRKKLEQQEGDEGSEKSKVDVVEAGAKEEKKHSF